MNSKDIKIKFPNNFLWGAATAAHQIEGSNHNQWTIWELENAKDKSKESENQIGNYESWNRIKNDAMDPNNYVSGNLANHYEFYLQDFDLLKKMNMNAYRFSIEWSRIEPDCGVWDKKSINYYKSYVTELRKIGIEPIVTLFHFTLPVWFQDKGGFEKRSNTKYFTRFAKKVVNELGDSIKYIITINEPEIYAVQSYLRKDWPPAVYKPYKFWRVVNNLAYTHRQTTKAIRKVGSHYKLSIAKNSCYFYPADNNIFSRLSTSFLRYIEDDYFIKKFIRHCDFLGVNYYISQKVQSFNIQNPIEKVSDLNWSMTPGDIQFVLQRLYAKYKIPIIITENGLADNQDSNRRWWITQTILAIQNAIKNGVVVKGYLHWSLIDNFEWAYGKWPRFGLAEVNYKTGKRTLRPSAKWFGRVIKKIRDV
ncbi:MAG: family 1 glycosylhydrolase [Candidatus Saccharibacteria bacterium]